MEGSIFWVGWGFKKIEGQSFSTDGGRISNQTGFARNYGGGEVSGFRFQGSGGEAES